MRSLARVELLQEEIFGTVSESWREDSLLCWNTEGIALIGGAI